MESHDQKFTNKTVSVVGVSVKEGQNKPGVEKAPRLFREGNLIPAIKQWGWEVEDLGDVTTERYAKEIEEEKANTTEYKFNHLPNIEILGVINNKLHEITHKASSDKNFVLTLGGDHSVGTGSISGLQKTYPDLKIIWVDAHGDCATPDLSDYDKYHGFPCAHLLNWIKKGDLKGFDWVDTILKKENLVFIGLRDLDPDERMMFKKHNIKLYTPYDIDFKGGIHNVMNEALEYLQCDAQHNNPVHISWDIDACDPSYIYATGTKARCGLTERESHFILKRTAATGNLIGLDMVEVNPDLEKDPSEIREVIHGDNPLLTGPPSLVYAMEFILSALGATWY